MYFYKTKSDVFKAESMEIDSKVIHSFIFSSLACVQRVFKTVSAEHSSIKAKIKIPERTRLNRVQRNLSKLKLSGWPRERKMNLKLSIF